MPPKKKGGKKKKKKEDTGPTVDEKYQQTLQQIDALKEHLALQTEVSRRSIASTSEMRLKVQEANDNIEAEQRNKLDISSDLARQYKAMQTELSAKIHLLHQTNEHLQEKLAKSQADFKAEREEKIRISNEKDEIIEELRFKIEHMETAYENVLHDSLDLLGDKINEAKNRWRFESRQIQSQNKDRLMEFGLNPLDL